jgi:streptogramin lyase
MKQNQYCTKRRDNMQAISSGGISYFKNIFPIILLMIVSIHSGEASAAPYKFERQWGNSGTGNGQLNGPAGVAVDSSGNVYVADYHNSRIQKFDSNGAYLTQWGSYGTGNGQFDSPFGVAVDSSGNVYVSDQFIYRIQKFDSNGAYLTQWGSSGTGSGQFESPAGVAVDSSGNVYVADSGNARIQKFDSNGFYLAQWGGSGIGNGQFEEPVGVAVDSSGNVYVSDLQINRIQKFDSNGVYLTQWGSTGTGNSQFDFPFGVAVDSSGNVYVSDLLTNRIQKFDSNGVYLTRWGSSGTGNGQFNGPVGVAVDSLDNVYVADFWNDRIQEFVLSPDKIAVVDHGYWYFDSNMNWQWDGTPTDELGVFGVGLTGATPVVGDWNAPGTSKTGVYWNGTWYLDMNGNGQWDGALVDVMYSFGAGLPDAIPVTGDWNGDGKTEIGVYVNGVWYLDMNGNGQWDGEPADKIAYFGAGLTGAMPVAGDWNRDGKSEIGVYQNGYWYLDLNGNGQWDGEPGDQINIFGIGLTNTVPVTGDWNADGKDEIGVYQDGYWYIDLNGNRRWDGMPADQFGVLGLGLIGAVPVPGMW